MSDTFMKLQIFEAGIVRVVGEFYRPNDRSRWEFREAVFEVKAKDALGGDRWENHQSMRSAAINHESRLSLAVWFAMVHLADVALKKYMESLVVKYPPISESAP